MNYMEQVAKMLGVELGEKFNCEENNYSYQILDTGLLCNGVIAADSLMMFCNGSLTIKRKPWKPKLDESYWYANMCRAVRASWSGCLTDILMYKLGNCYRTPEEAEANRDKWIAFYQSDEVLEV